MTWNRLDALHADLDASLAQSERESELIMADNGSRA
jgi:hypothetical protein